MLFRSALAQSVSSSFWVHCEKAPKRWSESLASSENTNDYLFEGKCLFFSLLCSVSAMVCNICECSLTFLSLPWLPPPPSPALPRNKARGKFFLQQRVETEFRSAQKSCEYLESCMMSHTASVLYQLERIVFLLITYLDKNLSFEIKLWNQRNAYQVYLFKSVVTQNT